MKVLLKAKLKNNKIVTIKWIIINDDGAITSSSGLISSDFFKDFLKHNYDNVSLLVDRQDMINLKYKTAVNIIDDFKFLFRINSIKNIILADDETFDFFTAYKISEKIRNKILPERCSNIDFEKHYLACNETQSTPDFSTISGQLELLSHLRSVTDKLILDIDTLPANLDRELVKALHKSIVTSGVCWEASTKNTKISKFDTTLSTLGGPLLITDNSPWPKGEGYFLEPICQFPTEILKILSLYEGEDGLAQFFMDESIISRVIKIDDPRETPKQAVKSIKDYRDEDTICEITGILPPKIYFNRIDDNALKNLIGIIDYRDILLLSCANQISIQSTIRAPAFMGSFRSVQYDHNTDALCILSLEDSEYVNFGDCGNAQIFLKNKKILFGEWSCY